VLEVVLAALLANQITWAISLNMAAALGLAVVRTLQPPRWDLPLQVGGCLAAQVLLQVAHYQRRQLLGLPKRLLDNGLQHIFSGWLTLPLVMKRSPLWVRQTLNQIPMFNLAMCLHSNPLLGLRKIL
jgi:hypothetical protein